MYYMYYICYMSVSFLAMNKTLKKKTRVYFLQATALMSAPRSSKNATASSDPPQAAQCKQLIPSLLAAWISASGWVQTGVEMERNSLQLERSLQICAKQVGGFKLLDSRGK